MAPISLYLPHIGPERVENTPLGWSAAPTKTVEIPSGAEHADADATHLKVEDHSPFSHLKLPIFTLPATHSTGHTKPSNALVQNPSRPASASTPSNIAPDGGLTQDIPPRAIPNQTRNLQ